MKQDNWFRRAPVDLSADGIHDAFPNIPKDISNQLDDKMKEVNTQISKLFCAFFDDKNKR
ncbi:hypothetical protein [Bacillus wiedmannii]|uniref:hypothetical protein n=1 Tax=Bacillus wiedmannii TaxID=1890302 RepID=UPI002E2208E8|nr:hypothetical protein [Bacillus wiedmannii]